MPPEQFYANRLTELNIELTRLKSRKSSFAWLRLGSIAAIIFVFYLLWSQGVFYVIGGTALLLFIFIRLVYADIDNQEKINHTTRLIEINTDEVKALNGDYLDFPDGAQHFIKEHPYAHDLDIFGRASLFQYINRTQSQQGSNTLAKALNENTSVVAIKKRQAAVKELSTKPIWVQNLFAIGKRAPISLSTQNRLDHWIKEPPAFLQFKPWKILRYILPCIIISICLLFAFDKVGYSVLYISLLIFSIIAYQINKVVAPIHNTLSKVADELNTLAISVQHIENESFESEQLKEWQSAFIEENKKTSGQILMIKKLLSKLDLRYNMVLSLPLNILLLWNLQQILDLEKWKAGQTESIDKWYNALGAFEFLSSLGTLSFNHPDWCFPQVREDYFCIKGEEIGHPLIPSAKRVNNFINIPSNDQLMLVTGSNMAGKSTYLRSIGINAVLALAGAPVCARSFVLSHVQVISSMRITDNLEESTSTFYAELKKLKAVIDRVNNGERVFILLDEILRGTNSLDRHTGSRALIEQLIRKKAPAIIATHDLELAELKNKYPNNILNYHFDVQVNNEELYFDYLLKPGICTSLNASILMKKIGIELKIENQ